MSASQINTPPPEPMSVRTGLIWLMFSFSSLVFIEPAPFDGLLILIGVSFFLSGLRVAPFLSTPFFFLSGYMVANIIATLFAPDPIACVKHMAVTFLLIFSWIFYASVIYDRPAHMYKIIFQGYITAAVIAVLLGLIGFLKVTPYYESFLLYGRVKGPFKDPNVFAPFLIPVVMYLIYQLENTKEKLKFYSKMMLLLFVAMGILMSFSRGALINLGLSCVLYAYFRFSTAKSKADTAGLVKIISMIVMAIAGIAIWAVITIDDVAQMFTVRAQLVQDYDQGSDGRFDAILNAVLVSIAHPLGIGPGQSSVVLALDPHNLLVHIMVETGFLGVISFVCFLIVTLMESYKLCKQSSEIQNICIIIFVCLVATLFESIIIHSTHWRHLYLLFGLLWGSIVAKKSNII